MLILTRRPVETICIGDDVTVTVLGVVGNQVRFGIEAPRSVVIDRAEVHERKKRAALANGNTTGGTSQGQDPHDDANGNVNGNLLEEEVEHVGAGDDDDRQQPNGNVAPLKLGR